METFLIILAIFIIGGIIYRMGKSNDDISQAPEGGCMGFLTLLSLIYALAPYIIGIGIIVFLVRACS